jgi:hypothetical protein
VVEKCLRHYREKVIREIEGRPGCVRGISIPAFGGFAVGNGNILHLAACDVPDYA